MKKGSDKLKTKAPSGKEVVAESPIGSLSLVGMITAIMVWPFQGWWEDPKKTVKEPVQTRSPRKTRQARRSGRLAKQEKKEKPKAALPAKKKPRKKQARGGYKKKF